MENDKALKMLSLIEAQQGSLKILLARIERLETILESNLTLSECERRVDNMKFSTLEEKLTRLDESVLELQRKE